MAQNDTFPSLSFNLIGAGRLGKNLAFALTQHGLARLRTLCNASLFSAEVAVNQIGTGRAVATLSDLDVADLVWITVADQQIAPIVAMLAEMKILKPGTIVAHCSGVLCSSILDPLLHQGCHTVSFHPLKAFLASQINVNVFQGCYCAIEGSPFAVQTIAALFKPLGAVIVAIQPEKKASYHAAATIASNYLVTLAATGIKLFEEAGFESALAKVMIHQLMQSSMNNIEMADSAKEALTGPLARGDTQTVTLQLEGLTDPVVRQLYCAAAQATLPLTELNAKQRHDMESLFKI